MKNKNPNFITICLTAMLVTSYISFALVAINAGFTQDFLVIWLRSWFIAFVMAVPSLIYVGSFVRNKVERENFGIYFFTQKHTK